jgi:hypothetical protein
MQQQVLLLFIKGAERKQLQCAITGEAQQNLIMSPCGCIYYLKIYYICFRVLQEPFCDLFKLIIISYVINE